MTSELNKWSKVAESAGDIEEFIQFLSSKGISLCIVNEKTERYMAFTGSIKDLIYEHFDIDFIQLEQERRSLLEEASKI